MKTLFFDCSMGAAGDMLMAALHELSDSKNTFIDNMNHLGISGLKVSSEKKMKCGINGTAVSVNIGGVEEISIDRDLTDDQKAHDNACNPIDIYDKSNYQSDSDVNPYRHWHSRSQPNEDHAKKTHGHMHEGHQHSHDCYSSAHSHPHQQDVEHAYGNTRVQPINSGMKAIEQLLGSLKISETVRSDALAVCRILAEAESHVHGTTMEHIHFNEVGTLDAVADIVGVSMLIEELKPDRIIASPIHVGSGHVECAHGILPVPAPATAHILTGIPTYGGAVKGELCTPTGAALLKHFVSKFGEMPVITVSAIGYGMGKKEFEAVSCVRAYLGET